MKIETRQQLEEQLEKIVDVAYRQGVAYYDMSKVGEQTRLKLKAEWQDSARSILDSFFPRPESERLKALRRTLKNFEDRAYTDAIHIAYDDQINLLHDLTKAAITQEEAKQ